jgi:predicted nucleotidyltransferase
MSKKIASFYNDEINSWLESVDFYLEEILSIEKRLEQIIARNTIVDIAAKTEVHQLIINKIEEKLILLRKEIESVRKLLSKKEDFVNDDKINKTLEHKISLLGSNFRHHEKEYSDVKFYCNEFLEEMLRRGEG